MNFKTILTFVLFTLMCTAAALLGNYIGTRYPIMGLILGLIGLVPISVYYIKLFCEKQTEKKQCMEYEKWCRINSHK